LKINAPSFKTLTEEFPEKKKKQNKEIREAKHYQVTSIRVRIAAVETQQRIFLISNFRRVLKCCMLSSGQFPGV